MRDMMAIIDLPLNDDAPQLNTRSGLGGDQADMTLGSAAVPGHARHQPCMAYCHKVSASAVADA